MFLLTIYERAKGERVEKKRGGEERLEFFYRFFVSLYLCIWGGVKGLVFLLRFLLTIYGDFVFQPGRPPCRLACRPSCLLTLSGYGISLSPSSSQGRSRRFGVRKARGSSFGVSKILQSGLAVCKVASYLKWMFNSLKRRCPQTLEIYKFSCEYTYNIYRFNCNFF